MGGHCLPVDPFYLTWRAREFHMSTEFIELAGKVNQQMPYYCVERIERALNDAAKPVKGSHIAILGVSYKGGVGDIRESPALRIIEVLAQRGAALTYHDPFVPALPRPGPEEHAAGRPARRRRGRAGHRPPGDRLPRGRRPRPAVRRPARHHPRDQRRRARPSLTAADVVDFGPYVAKIDHPRRQRRSAGPKSRARSSVGERSLHTREVAGSSPAVPIITVIACLHGATWSA